MSESHLIESIFNYCNRRCELCVFTERCAVFNDMREYERQHPDRSPLEETHDKFQEVFRLLEAWCEREGIDFEALEREANTEQVNAEFERHEAGVRVDPLHILASSYAHAAMKLVDALSAARALRRWPPDVSASVDTIAWNAGMVAVKMHRALGGFAARHDWGEQDDVQNDWNGSAKVARLIVAESLEAWRVVMKAGEATPDSPLTELVAMLERIDEGLAARFPRAMEFTRPGFDEPLLAEQV